MVQHNTVDIQQLLANLTEDSYVRVKDVEDLLNKLCDEPAYQHEDEDFYVGVSAALDGIQDLPTVAIKHGTWKPKNVPERTPDGYYYWPASIVAMYECSECGRVELKQEPYCNCGAIMKVAIIK